MRKWVAVFGVGPATTLVLNTWLILSGAGLNQLLAGPLQGPVATQPDQLAEAKRLLDDADYDAARGQLDRVISSFGSSGKSSDAVLIAALELRASVRFSLNDRDGATADLLALLSRDPSHQPSAWMSPRVAVFFNETRASTLARVHLVLSPPDAEVRLDGRPFSDSGEFFWLNEGRHTVLASRVGYESTTKEILAAPGGSEDVELSLTRVAATVRISTVPAGAELFLRNSSSTRFESVGTTAPADPKNTAGVQGILTVPSVKPGKYLGELRLACYVTRQFSLAIDELRDYSFAPLELELAAGSISTTSSVPNTAVFLDGRAIGTAPLRVSDVCEGRHVVEFRSDFGRAIRRFELHRGESEAVAASPRPSFALVSAGAGSVLLSAGDLTDLEGSLKSTQNVSFIVPSDEEARAAFSLDGAQRAINDLLRQTVSQRSGLTERYAKLLHAQGLAIAQKTSPSIRSIRLLVFASGSAEPDAVEFSLDDSEHLPDALSRIDPVWESVTYMPSVKFTEVADSASPVVLEPMLPAPGAAPLGPGDQIVAVNGTPVSNVADIAKISRRSPNKDAISLDVRSGTSAPRTVAVPLVTRIRALSVDDRTAPFNTLVAALQVQAASTTSLVEQAAAKLNLGIALMHLRNTEAAIKELEAVKLPARPGVSQGTVDYLLSVGYDAVGRSADADAARERARKDGESMLTEDGPSVKELLAHGDLAPSR